MQQPLAQQALGTFQQPFAQPWQQPFAQPWQQPFAQPWQQQVTPLQQTLQQPVQLMRVLEPIVRTELLEAIPALARTFRHTATASALVGMGLPPVQAYQLTERWKAAGIIPVLGPESRILMQALGPTGVGFPTAPLAVGAAAQWPLGTGPAIGGF